MEEVGEHVDDHQVQIAAELDRRGLAVSAHVDELSLDLLLDAAGRSVMRSSEKPALKLVA